MIRAFLLAATAALGLILFAPGAPLHGLTPLVRALNSSEDAAVHRDILRGMVEALQGRRNVLPPDGWPAVARKLDASPDAEVRRLARRLSVLFGDREAVAALRRTAADPNAKPADRRDALQALAEAREDGLLPLLRSLLDDAALRGTALRALAAYNDPSVARLILDRYATFPAADKADAVATLAARPASALALVEAMAQGRVPRGDLSPFTARQIQALKDKRLTQRLTEVWGQVRPPAKGKTAELSRYLALVPPAALAKADRGHGRAVFDRTCARCHTLFHEGGKIGPDLTGSQRSQPEYVLTKVLDPNAVVARDYQMTVLETADGRVLSGIVKEDNGQTVTLQTPTELVRLPKKDVQNVERSNLSMMPEGLLKGLSDAEVCDLIAYLAGTAQVSPRPGKH